MSFDQATRAPGLHGRVWARRRASSRRATWHASLGPADVISFDMGGTTAKVGLVRDGITTRSPRTTRSGTRRVPARAGARQRLPDPDAGHRSGRDRGRRRQHRLGRLRAAACASARRAPAPIPDRLLRPRRRRDRRSPTPTWCSAASTRTTSWAARWGSMSTPRRGAIEQHVRRAARDSIVVDAAHGIIEIANAAMTQRDPSGLGPARLRSARLSPWSRSAAPARCTRTASPPSSRCRSS